MSTFDYDLFVIGGGSGGVRAARVAASHGAKVAIAEEYRYGGTCVIRGCVPKKLLVYASQFSSHFEEAEGFGWSVPYKRFDWPTLISNKNNEIARLEDIYLNNLKRARVQPLRCRAELLDHHTINLVGEDRQVTAKYILIATGGTPRLDEDLLGTEHCITSNEAFHLNSFPRQIVIYGGGYIAVEFAGIFNGLGATTTLVYRGDKILRGFDDDIRSALTDEMEKKGIKIICNETFKRVEEHAAGYAVRLSGGRLLEANQVMLAIGRDPNSRGLGLEQAGVEVNHKGAVQVDAYSQTNVDNIFAVGDVTDRVALTPVAIREGHAFADTIFGGRKIKVDHSTIPTAVFSQPEIGTVGLTEAQARASYAAVDIYKSTFRPMKHTLSGSHEKMLMKLIVDKANDRVVGCHIMGPDAGEMAQLLGIAVKMGATKADFDATMAVHPTAAEELVTMREKWSG